MKIITDLHMHTTFSFDGKNSLEEMIETAIDKGLKFICITDHFDCNRGLPNMNFEDYYNAVSCAKDKFKNKITILKGVELGDAMLDMDKYRLVMGYDLDMVLCSAHYLNEGYFVGDKEETSNLYRYYYQVLKVLELDGLNSLAHVDLPVRYMEIAKNPELISEYLKDKLTCSLEYKILETVIKKDMALEINTSSLRNGIMRTLPYTNILDKYKELGGEKITIGSDAHNIEDICAGFDFIEEKVLKRYNNLKFGIYKNKQFEEVSLCG